MKFLLGCGVWAAAVTAFFSAAEPPRPNPSGVPRPLPAVLDTLIAVHGHVLHFNVWRGHGPDLLFEVGGGDDLAVWNDLLAPLYRATGATLVTYDRAGFGRGTLDSGRVGLAQQVADLHATLARLPGTGRYMLVGHSYGGFCATLFAARYPGEVAGAVLVDANHVAYFTDARVRAIQAQFAPGQAQRRTAAPGLYWLLAGLANDQRAMRRAPFPRAVPVVDIVAKHPPFASPRDVADWQRAHRRFVAAAPNRQLVTATGSGHYVMRDRPQLLVRTIAQFYRRCLPRPK